MKIPGWMKWLIVVSLIANVGMWTLWQMAERGWADAVTLRDDGEAGSKDAEVVRQRHVMLDEIINVLEKNFDGPVDRTAVVNGALKGAAASVGDRYTELQVPSVASRQREQVEGKYAGVGVVIVQKFDGTLEVRSVWQDGPADSAGMLKGDVIVEADGKSLKGLSNADAMDLIRGEPGTGVALTIVRGEELKTLRMTRRVLPIESVERIGIVDEAAGIGYIYLSSFSVNTPEQFRSGVERLIANGMKSLVIDLRGNGGGSLDSAVEIADDLTDVNDAVVLRILAQSEEAIERKRLSSAHDTRTLIGEAARTGDSSALFLGPLVLLVDGNSASASEILVGCLQDWGRAFVIGESTYGKSRVQLPIKLSSNPDYTLKVTVASYVTPLGNWLRPKSDNDEGGIIPDVEITLSDAERLSVYQSFRDTPDPKESLGMREGTTDKPIDPHLLAAIAVLKGEIPKVRANQSE